MSGPAQRVRVDPPAPVVLIKRVVALAREAHNLFVVDCPWCGREHVHGSGGGLGPRLSHCRDGARGYVLAGAP